MPHFFGTSCNTCLELQKRNEIYCSWKVLEMHRGHTETGRKEFLKKAHFFALHSHSARAATQPGYRMSSGCLMGKWCSPLHCRYLKQYVKLKADWTGFLHEPTFIRNLHCQFFYIFFHLTVWIRARKLKLYSSKVKALKKRAGVSTIFDGGES